MFSKPTKKSRPVESQQESESAQAALVKATAPAAETKASKAVEKAAEKASPVAATAPAATAVAAATVTPIAARAVVAAPAGRDRTAIVTTINMLRDKDADVARDAAARLGTLPADVESVDALADVVRNADGYFHSVVRAAAAHALGRLGDKRAVPALVHGTRDNMAEASEEAVKALGLLKDAAAVSTLEAIVRNADGFYLEQVRKTAAEAIKQIRTK